jgi:hypothetical protein
MCWTTRPYWLGSVTRLAATFRVYERSSTNKAEPNNAQSSRSIPVPSFVILNLHAVICGHRDAHIIRRSTDTLTLSSVMILTVLLYSQLARSRQFRSTEANTECVSPLGDTHPDAQSQPHCMTLASSLTRIPSKFLVLMTSVPPQPDHSRHTYL